MVDDNTCKKLTSLKPGAFPINFAGCPYNTLTLPCERVITEWSKKWIPIFTSARRYCYSSCLLVYVLVSVPYMATKILKFEYKITFKSACI